MKKILIGILAIFFLLSGVAVAAEEKGTADEAIALVGKALNYYKANGKQKAFAAFNDTEGQFRNRDLYIFAIDYEGAMVAHGANARLIGKSLGGLQDSKGFYFIKAMIDTVKKDGSGWVDYYWTNPVSKHIEPKSSYVQKADDSCFIGCGIYK